MRVLCSAIDGQDVEGEVIDAIDFDPIAKSFDTEETFTGRCDDGSVFEVHG